MSATNPPPSKAAIIPALSGLRGVAALAVIYLHQNAHSHGQENMGGWDTWHEFGHMAVIFFFVLSAFLLTYRGLHDIKRASDVKYVTIANTRVPVLSLRWISYFVRRLFRIYPCYMVTVMMAMFVRRFRAGSDEYYGQAYYYDFATEKPLEPNQLLDFALLRNVKSLFWTIPPEIEYYFCLPIIIVLFEAAQYFDERLYTKMFGSKESETSGSENQSLGSQVAMAVVGNLGRGLFRTLHLVVFSVLSLPGVLDTPYWNSVEDKHHLPPHFFRFWTGSFTAIVLYLLERNGLVPQPFQNGVKQTLQNVSDRLQHYAKKLIFLICDLGCWAILAAGILTLPWYQGHYFGRQIPKVDADEYMANKTNTTFVFYHPNVYNQQWHEEHISSTRGLAYVCGFLVFLICYGARNGSFSRFFLWSFFTWSGEVSFPLYLTHFIALREYTRLWRAFVSPQSPLLLDNVILGMLMSILVATIMHYVIEKPCMKAGSYLVRYLRATAFKPTPTTLPVSSSHPKPTIL
jgi:peptidoglycan/LPS O-acetylase OafA/YrhL